MFEWDHRVSNGWNADTWCLGKHIDEWCDPADRAQRQRELGGHRQHGVAAQQHQGERVVLPERRRLVGRFSAATVSSRRRRARTLRHSRVAGDALLGPVLRGGDQLLWSASSQPA